MDDIFAIISGGEYASMPDIEKAKVVVACDKGYEYALAAGINPGVIVGDFDSYSGKLPSGVETIRLPIEKDDTDTVSAVKLAIGRGAKIIYMYCAEGGRRPEHFIGNLQAAAFAAKQGVCVTVFGQDTLYRILSPGKYVFNKKQGYLSLFSLSGECTGVTLKGTKYTLSAGMLDSCFPLGISNEWTDDKAELEFCEGVMLVITRKQ